MKLRTLRDVLNECVRDLYSAEKQLLKALPRMAKAAGSADLKAAFTSHLRETEGQVERLEKVCDELNVKPAGKKCKAMEGLIEEGKEVLEVEATPEARDAALIEAAQKVEHYEMAGYGSARTFAAILGEVKAAKLLQQTLDEEKRADEKLSALAESGLNEEAITPDTETSAPRKGRKVAAR
jgi:ferritin-like metal-binding protein YciE